MATPTVSVIIPAFNEERTVGAVIEAVRALPLDLEIVCVDDGSTDSTWEAIASHLDGDLVRGLRRTRNGGKGAAVRDGLAEARGELIVIQDADLEQDPSEYPRLLAPLMDGRASVVYGIRTRAGRSGSVSPLYIFGNWVLAITTTLLYFRRVRDMETGYKCMRRDVALSLDLQARGFDLEPEITAKLLRLGHRLWEVPVTYHARGREEGKKITPRDGLIALLVLVRYRFWRPREGAPKP